MATGDFANAIEVSVYFKPDVQLSKAEQLARSVRDRAGVTSAILVSAEQGLKEFREHSGFGEALDALQENPLPHVLRVRPTPEASTLAAIESLERYFSAWPEVELVQSDADWVRRFNAILELLRRVLTLTAIALSIGVLAIIGNTIRLEILNRRSEIEVTKLVGGSNAFVRRPFLYTGILYGLIGATVSWLLLSAAVMALGEPVANLARLYGSRFSLQGLSAEDSGALLLAGVALGWIGAWVSASKHLRAIEPRA
jgi:cell division transport system permease protein